MLEIEEEKSQELYDEGGIQPLSQRSHNLPYST